MYIKYVIFVGYNRETMEHIRIFSGNEVISYVLSDEDIKGVEPYLEPYLHIFAVMDRNVVAGCPAAGVLVKILEERNVRMMFVDASEGSKTLDSVKDICGWLLENGADRDALVLAVGGGITTDMAGFASSIYKRGVRFAYIPTTLLSQVDAAIGGKTGVNFDDFKNMLGVICQPVFTFLSPDMLEGLPRRDFLSGAAEMLKTFIIEDGGNYRKAAGLFSEMSSEFSRRVSEGAGDAAWQEMLRERKAGLGELIEAAARVKAGVVSRDAFERGERRKLNLGHTFAHAIETLAQRDGGERFTEGVTHGEAVAMGLVLAARLSDRYYSDGAGGLEDLVKAGLSEADMQVICPYTIEEMALIMSKDKKAEGGKIHFVIPKAIGDVEIVDLTIEEVCRLMA